MSRVEPLVRIPVGVVIERRKSNSPWVDFVWCPVTVLPGVPDTAPWTMLDGNGDRASFYGGPATVELYRSDTAGYRDNIAAASALLWVVLRPTSGDPPVEIAAVTAEPSEGEAFTESASNLVESVPMPDQLRTILVDFIAEHHVDRPFEKRKPERADPEAMARHRILKDR